MPTSSLAPAPQAWQMPGLATAAGWAERLVAMSLSLRGARPAARGFSPAEAARPAPSLTTAIAAIVAVAAQRAQTAGTLPALRDAVLRALDEAEVGHVLADDPREASMAGIAPITDAAAQEREQLMSLMYRQRG